MAEAQITNPRGAYGQAADAPRNTHEFKASTTVTANRVVAIGTDYTVAVAATDGAAGLAIGVSQNLGGAAVGAPVASDVTIWGLAKAVPVAGAVAAGDVLKRSVTTAGYLSATATPATGEKLAVALAASASNVVDCWICK